MLNLVIYPIMRITEKLKQYKPKSLAHTTIFLVFVLFLILTGLFTFFNFIKLKEMVTELNIKQVDNMVLAYSEILDGDSIELDLKRREKNIDYDRWVAISENILKKTRMKYLYVMNASYNDSMEVYMNVGGPGNPNFLQKETIEDFDTDIINKLKNKSERIISKMDYYPHFGWLIYSYASIRNSRGEIVAIAGADKELFDVDNDVRKIGTKLLTSSIMFFAIVFLLVTYLIRKIFLSPIEKIIEAADNFNLLNVSFKNISVTYIKEYDALIDSFRKMENKINYAIKKSFTDELTKLNNRYFFALSLENILKPVKQEKKIAFMIIDLDSFKQINDTYGHEKGDFVLRNVGIILKQVFGSLPGVVVRLGGDEFAVCLDDVADRQVVEDKCNALKAEFSQITYVEGKTGIGASIGIIMTKFSETPPIYTEIFSAADNNLYKVKARGKNGYLITEI